MKKLPIGVSDFKKLLEKDCYYVDKTLLVKEIMEASGEVILIPRPRRFGKTLNLSMLKYFNNIELAKARYKIHMIGTNLLVT